MKQKNKKILIIQQKMIGDVLTCSVLFEILRKELPNAQLDYLINANTYPVVQNNPYIDNFILLSPDHLKAFKNLQSIGKKLKKNQYDVVIDSYSKISSNILSYYSKAKMRISYDKWYSNFLYTNTYKRQVKASSHAGLAIENRIALLKPVLNKVSHPLPPKIYLTQQEKDNAKNYLLEKGIDLDRPIYMISVLGSSSLKTYPKNYMAFLINTLVESSSKAQVLFNYLPSQLEQVESIFNLCDKEVKTKIRMDIFGKTLRDFIAITSFCNAVIGNEGGAINIAKALGKKTFSVFSPWIEQEEWTVYEDGINNISVHLKDFYPELYAGISEKSLKEKSIVLYEKLTPYLFEAKYKKFLENTK